MHNMFVISIILFMAFFMIANGLLLAFWPQRFLRFYDFWNRGDYVGRTAPWRKNVEKIEYRLLGLGALVVGIAMSPRSRELTRKTSACRIVTISSPTRNVMASSETLEKVPSWDLSF